MRIRPRRSRAGGCDFAVDPRLRADRTPVHWLPAIDPGLALLTALPETLFTASGLDAADAVTTATAPEGVWLDLRMPSSRALHFSEPAIGPVGFVLPFDALFADRIDAAWRLYRLLVSGRATTVTFTAPRRRRLKLALRALDGALDGADYREIAEALFGDRVPAGAAFRVDSLRAQAIRLVRTGRALMRGGYLDLLRPERRGRRRPRSS